MKKKNEIIFLICLTLSFLISGCTVIGNTWRANFEKDRLEYEDELIFLNQDFSKIHDVGDSGKMDLVVYGSRESLSRIQEDTVELDLISTFKEKCQRLSVFLSDTTLSEARGFDEELFRLENQTPISLVEGDLFRTKFDFVLNKKIVEPGCGYTLTFLESRGNETDPSKSTKYQFLIDRDNFTAGVIGGISLIVLFLIMSTV